MAPVSLRFLAEGCQQRRHALRVYHLLAGHPSVRTFHQRPPFLASHCLSQAASGADGEQTHGCGFAAFGGIAEQLGQMSPFAAARGHPGVE